MTTLFIIGAILLLLFLLAALRVTLKIAYDQKFEISVSVLSIKIFSNDKKKKEKSNVKSNTEESSKSDKEDNIFKKIYKQKGLKYTVDLCTELLKKVVNKLLWILKKIEVRNFLLSLSVVGSDAADTAIKYGAVCAAVYPAVAFLDTNLNFKPKKIDVYADFEGKDIKFKISTDIKASVFTLVLLAVAVLKEFFKLKKRVEADLASTENNSVKDVL